MDVNYLFHNKYKRIGWFILVPSAIIGLIILLIDYEPDFMTFNIPTLFVGGLFEKKGFFGMRSNNILNDLIGVLVIVSSLIVAFSKEKTEDEYISKIRLESLVWAVFVNYGILLVSFILIHDVDFIWVMLFNMFTVLLFFIVKFYWQISKLKKVENHEE